MPEWLALPAVLLVVYLLTVAVDPYIGFGSPLAAQALNAAVPLVAACAILAITGRVPHAIAAGLVVELLFYTADHIKMRTLFSNLVFADLKLVPELLKNSGLVAGFVRASALTWLVIVLASAAAIAALVWVTVKTRPTRWVWRVVSGVFALAGGVTMASAQVSMNQPSIGWNLPMQITGARQAGINGNVLLGMMASNNVKPRPDAAAVARFWREPLVQATKARTVSLVDDEHRPDIIIVQSESLFEPSMLCGFPDTPFLETVSDNGRNSSQLTVPVFGHRTLQTEFEVLSGFPVSFAPNSLFSYYELVDHPLPAFPRELRRLGYRTIAIHPSVASFWRRDYAMPALGFDDFISGSSYFRGSDFSTQNWVTDDAMVKSVLSQLDAATSPAMVFAVSIENHGPWGVGRFQDDPAIQSPNGLTAQATPELRDYLGRARHADRSLKALIAALEKRERPTMVVFYGDHLPALDQTYNSLCFKDRKRPEQHMPPVRAWANFPLKVELPAQMDSYVMAGWVLRAAGLPVASHFEAASVLAAMELDPGVAEGDLRRLKSLYAHVAAQSLFQQKTPEKGDGLAKVVGEPADSALHAMRDGGEEPVLLGEDALKLGKRGRTFKPADGGMRYISFNVDQRLANLTVRPYIVPTKQECLLNPATGNVLFEAVGDGRVLVRSRLTAGSVKIASLPLSGVKKLSFRVTTNDGSAGCDEVSYAVSQLLCYSANCDKRGSSPYYESTASLAVDAAAAAAIASEPDPAALSSDMDRLRYMMTRSVGSFAPYAPIRVTPDNKLFLHPTADQNGWIEFDTSGIDRLTLTGNIQPLDAACQGNAQGGIVGVEVALDGKQLGRSIVDRNTPWTVQVPVAAGKRLRVTVDPGNKAPWCDWFAVGFSEVHAR